MGNPHPTNSKPFKIGRKHTGAPSLRAIGRRRSAGIVREKMKLSKYARHKYLVSEFWSGKLERHPQPISKESTE